MKTGAITDTFTIPIQYFPDMDNNMDNSNCWKHNKLEKVPFWAHVCVCDVLILINGDPITYITITSPKPANVWHMDEHREGAKHRLHHAFRPGEDNNTVLSLNGLY